MQEKNFIITTFSPLIHMTGMTLRAVAQSIIWYFFTKSDILALLLPSVCLIYSFPGEMKMKKPLIE